MDPNSRIFLAGHCGLVGSALHRQLQAQGYREVITRTRAELDLERQEAVERFFLEAQPEYVFLAAAKVGGILANASYPAEFVYQNLAIQTHTLHAAWKTGVKRLIFLGSSCIYPRDCPQPMKEEHLLTGSLESTNRPYAVAKIAGVEMCAAYNRQYGSRFLAVMPTNLYGPGDNFDLETSHVLPALVRKFHLAKLARAGQWHAIEADRRRFGPIPAEVFANLRAIAAACGHPAPFPAPPQAAAGEAVPPPGVVLWGSGEPRREFLHVDDAATACLFLMNADDAVFGALCHGADLTAAAFAASHPPLVNIGCGADLSVKTLAETVAEVVGYDGEISWDTRKPDGTPRKLLDVTRLLALGWSPRIPLTAGLAATYRWYLEQEGS
jgi:GDP-L-fucose synthase